MPIEIAAIDYLTENAHMPTDLAIAVAKSIDASITGANLVTVPVFNARLAAVDVRFAQLETKIERSIASAKMWAISLYAALPMTFFGALAADHHWLATRQDTLTEQIQGLSNNVATMQSKFDAVQARFDAMQSNFDTMQSKFDAMQSNFAAMQSKVDSLQSGFGSMQSKLDSIRGALQQPRDRPRR